MAVLDSTTLEPDFIKTRWLEPFVSSANNRKSFKTQPRGIYSGFVVKPGPGAYDIQVKHDDPEGYGEVSGYAGGNFDAASGWSTAVHASIQGFATHVAILSSATSNFTFDLTSYAGTTVYVALDVNYSSGTDTTGQLKIVDATELDADGTLINLARVDVPSVAPITDANIIRDDPAYPRVLPFANRFKYGFMDKFQAALLEDIANVSGLPAFTFEVEIATDGSPQTIPLPPGARYTVGGDDLWLWKNGNHKTKGAGRDYLEVDRGDGYGEEISYIGPLYAGDRIKMRLQEFSSVLTSRTQVLDENALISDNVVFFNFTGTGVSVLPDGPNRVRVVIPGGGGAGGQAIRTKFNSSGVSIAQYRAVHLKSDNSIEAFDPTDLSQTFYGLTNQMFPVATSGDVILPFGVLENAGVGIAGLVGSDVYVAHDGLGTLVTGVPNALSGQVVRVGQLDATAGSTVTDIAFDVARMA